MIEIMISIAVMVIVVGLAIPALSNLFSRNQTRAAANLFMDDLRQARYESRTRSNSTVSVCAIGSAVKDNTINYDTNEAYEHGWLWFTGTTLLGKNHAVSDGNVSVTPLINFRVELRRGQLALWNKDDVATRSEITIPYDVSVETTYPSISFSDTTGRTSMVVFDETGRTTVNRVSTTTSE